MLRRQRIKLLDSILLKQCLCLIDQRHLRSMLPECLRLSLLHVRMSSVTVHGIGLGSCLPGRKKFVVR